MSIERRDRNYDPDEFKEWHRLVVAEDGFSVLSGIGQHDFGLQSDVIREFAEEVNRRDEGGSLHPRAPISALPRRYFRNGPVMGNPRHIESFKQELRDFIAANRTTIGAKKILVDFPRMSGACSQRASRCHRGGLPGRRGYQ